jgi:hypothetical protein
MCPFDGAREEPAGGRGSGAEREARGGQQERGVRREGGQQPAMRLVLREPGPSLGCEGFQPVVFTKNLPRTFAEALI